MWQVSITSPGTMVIPTNKTDLHDIDDIMLKVAELNINVPNPSRSQKR